MLSPVGTIDIKQAVKRSGTPAKKMKTVSKPHKGDIK